MIHVEKDCSFMNNTFILCIESSLACINLGCTKVWLCKYATEYRDSIDIIYSFLYALSLKRANIGFTSG